MSKELIKGTPNKALIDAIVENCGELSFVAEDLGLTIRQVEGAIAKSDELKEAMRIGRNHLLDIAERCLVNAMARGDSATARFVLKHLGQGRGYQPDQPQAATAVQVNIGQDEDRMAKVRAMFGVNLEDIGQDGETH